MRKIPSGNVEAIGHKCPRRVSGIGNRDCSVSVNELPVGRVKNIFTNESSAEIPCDDRETIYWTVVESGLLPEPKTSSADTATAHYLTSLMPLLVEHKFIRRLEAAPGLVNKSGKYYINHSVITHMTQY